MAPQPHCTKQMSILEEEMMELSALKEVQQASKKYMAPTVTEQREIDSRSIYVGNVDWKSTEKEIEEFFGKCGQVLRVTIPKDKYTGRQKNFAYVEFAAVDCVANTLLLTGSIFRNRPIYVSAKRTNVPGMGATPQQKHAHRSVHKSVVCVKYVYINGPAPRQGSRSKRFHPYSKM